MDAASFTSAAQSIALAQRAYGVRPAQGPQRTAPVSAPKIQQASAQANTPSPKVARLVAGVVGGGIDFSVGDAPSVRPASIPLYTSAGQLNAAATGVEAGRRLDVQA